MRRNRDGVDPQQTNSLRIAHTDSFGVGQFDFRKAHAFAEDVPFLFRSPLRRQREKLVQLIDRCLSIHHDSEKEKSSRRQNLRLKILPN